jgi:hypothetical protein
MLTSDESLGDYLRELIKRSGLTQTAVARAMGYKGASSIQRFLDPEYGRGGLLPIELATKFAKALVGRGDPPIQQSDVFWLSGVELTDRATFRALTAAGAFELGMREYPADIAESEGLAITRGDVFKMPKDLPAFATEVWWHSAMNSDDSDAVILEENEVTYSKIIRLFRRPNNLQFSDKAYVHYVQGSAMEPKFEEGEAVLLDPRRPIKARDYVFVMLSRDTRKPNSCSGILRRLVRRTAEFVELEQFTPPATFRIPNEDVSEIYSVCPWIEVLDF